MTSETSTARPRGQRRDAAENREAIIAAAANALNADPNASLDTIATIAGLSRRAFYGHFATRDDLLRELALHGAERINAALAGGAAAAGDEAADPAVELALLGARLWDEIDHVRVMALVTLRGPLLYLVGDALSPLRRRVHGLIGRGVADGVFRDDIPLARLSRLVESAAISVLDEATRHGLTTDEGRRLVVLSVLGMVGYGHRDAAAIAAGILRPDSTTKATNAPANTKTPTTKEAAR